MPADPHNTPPSPNRLLPRGQRRWLAAAIGMATLAALSGIGLVAASGWLITASGLAGAATGVVTLEIFAPGALIRLFAVSRTATRYLERIIGHDALLRLSVTIRRDLFLRHARLDFERLLRLREGAALSQLISDTEQLEHVHARLTIPVLGAGIAAIVAILMLTWLTSATAGLLLAATLLMILLITIPGRSRIFSEFRLHLDNAAYRRELLGTVAAHRDLYFADPDSRAARRLMDRSRRIQHRESRLATLAARQDAVIHLLLLFVIIALLLIAGLASTGRLSEQPAWLALSLFTILGMGALLSGLGTAIRQWSPARVAKRQLFNEDRGPSAPGDQAASPHTVLRPNWRLTAVRLERGITDSPILDDVDLSIAPGEQITIVGPSGSGKSRLAALLTGLIPPDAGRITLDGQPIGDLGEASRFATVTLLEQQSHLLDDTLRHNLAAPSSDVTDDRLMEAIQATGLHRSVPGLDTLLSTSGRALSGGEARRACLIRAVLAPTPALILDEPFRGLDVNTRARVLAWLREALAGRTVILLDHRPCPGFAEDTIYRIENGELSHKPATDRP